MTEFRVVLPGQPPSANHQYEPNYGRPGLHKRAGIEAYQAGVTHIVRTSRPKGWDPGPDYLIVEYEFFLTRDVDCTNAIKVIEDAIATALCPGLTPPRCCTKFDERFLPRAIDKVKSHDPRVEVRIRPDILGRRFSG